MRLRWILLLLMACAAAQPLSVAQSLAQSVRVVQGTVQNSDGQPQANAVVYLQDQKTLEVRTFITEADGHYRFGQLSFRRGLSTLGRVQRSQVQDQSHQLLRQQEAIQL